MNDLVFISENKTKTTSIKVADYFGKRHSDVLDAIRSLGCTADFGERNFSLATYNDAQGKNRPYYQMTKDGFIFLVMGFRGTKAASLKEAYIRAFNEMEASLKTQQVPQLSHAQALLESVQLLVALESKVNSIAESQASLIQRVEKVEKQPVNPIQITINKAKDYKTVRKEQLLEEYRRPIADLVLTIFSHIDGYAERWRTARALYHTDTGDRFPHVDKANENQLRDFLRWLNSYRY